MTNNDRSIIRQDATITIEVHSPDDLRFLKEQNHECESLTMGLFCNSVDLSYVENFEKLTHVTFKIEAGSEEEISIDCTPLFKNSKLERIEVVCNQEQSVSLILEPLALLHHVEMLNAFFYLDPLTVLHQILSDHSWSFTNTSPRSLRWIVEDEREGIGWGRISNLSNPPQWVLNRLKKMGVPTQDIWDKIVSTGEIVDSNNIMHHLLRTMGLGEFIGMRFSLGEVLRDITTVPRNDIKTGELLGYQHDVNLNRNYDEVLSYLGDRLEDILESYLEDFEYFDTSWCDIEVMRKSRNTERFVPRILEMQREGVHRGLESRREEVSVPLYLVWGWASQSKTGLVDPAVLWKTYYGSIILERMKIERGDLIDIETAKDIVERVEVLMMQSEKEDLTIEDSQELEKKMLGDEKTADLDQNNRFSLKQKESKNQFLLREKILQYAKISADSEGFQIRDIVAKLEKEDYSAESIQLEVFNLIAEGLLVETQPGRFAPV